MIIVRILAASLCLAFAVTTSGAGEMHWIKHRDNGGFGDRDSARTFIWRGRPWISNGYVYGGAARRDLITTNNGSDWFTVNASTPYPAYSPIGVHGGKIFVVGSDKVLTTLDGVNFTTILDPTPFTGNFAERPFITDFVAAGETEAKMYLFLGDKVHYSEDGITWGEAATPWNDSYLSYAGIAYDGKVYIMGGDITQANTPVEPGYAAKTSLNDIWVSDKPEDINSWVRTTAPWAPRMWPSLAVHMGKLWLTGGYSNLLNANFDDTWTFDGANWEKHWIDTSFTSRHAAVMFSLNGYLFVVGGNRNPDVGATLNDVWFLRE